MKTLNEFKAFILRGNVVDLAVGIVIGAAFTTVVKSFVDNLINPLISAFGGKPNLGYISFSIGKGVFLIGNFLNDLITFLIVAAVVFFFVVRPINQLIAMRKTEPPPDPTTRDCPYCLSNIPVKASKCAFCGSEVPAVQPVAVG